MVSALLTATRRLIPTIRAHSSTIHKPCSRVITYLPTHTPHHPEMTGSIPNTPQHPLIDTTE
ncbi:hypothetical protein XFEB_00967 [Xylella fastidiosa EB92.1]|nr:hypothetical protein XFEB_00967 [Xylella fastidiosa EB92.1]